MDRSRTIVTTLLLALMAGVLLAVNAYKPPVKPALPARPAQPEMESLIAFVLKTGKPTYVPAAPLRYFQLPAEDLQFHQLKAVSESDRTRAIQVQRRESGTVVFLLDLLANSTAGYFYLTDENGRLRKAAFFDEAPEAVEDAEQRFEHELEKLAPREAHAAGSLNDPK